MFSPFDDLLKALRIVNCYSRVVTDEEFDQNAKADIEH